MESESKSCCCTTLYFLFVILAATVLVHTLGHVSWHLPTGWAQAVVQIPDNLFEDMPRWWRVSAVMSLLVVITLKLLEPVLEIAFDIWSNWRK